MATSKIDAALCERLVNTVAGRCVAATSPPAPQSPPPTEWDALANSFAALSAAFAWGAILLAILAVGLGVGWGFLVKVWAEREARKEAAECVKKQMDKWLADEAPVLIRQHVENLQGPSLGNGDEAEAADEMGKEAG